MQEKRKYHSYNNKQGNPMIGSIIKSIIIILMASATGISHGSLLAANSLALKQLNAKNGLPAGFINAVTQDNDGYIWIASNVGIARYDGKKYKKYIHNPNDINSITNNDVTDILEDDIGRLWLGTKNGLDRLSKDRSTITHFRNNENDDKSLSNDRVISLSQDTKGRIWVATNEGLNRYNEKSNSFHRYLHDERPGSISDNRISFILEDRDNKLWVGTINGLNQLDEKSGTFNQYLQKEETITKRRFIDGIIDNTGMLWLATDGDGLIKFNPNTYRHTQWLSKGNNDKNNILKSNRLWKLTQDNKNRIWIGYFYDGISLFNQNTNTSIHLEHQKNNNNSIPSDRISDFFIDKSGLIWIATNNGLAIHNIEKQKILKITGDKLSDSNVHSILESDSNIWIGTDNGINKLNLITGEIEKIIDIGKSINKSKVIIWDIKISQDKKYLWLGSNWGLLKYNIITGSTEFLAKNDNYQNQLSDTPVYAIAHGRNGEILLGTYSGVVASYNPEQGIVRTNDYLANKSIFITKILLDQKNNAWLATEKGVFKINLNSFLMEKVNISENIYENLVNDIVIDKNNNLWVASSTDGLLKISTHNEKPIVKKYTDKQGLPSNIIKSISLDNENNLWLTTQDKLASININNDKINIYHSLFTDLDNEYYDGSALNRIGKWAAFGGNNGIILFKPNTININSFEPNVIITSIMKVNEEVKLGSNKPIEFSFKDRLLTFNFSSLDYSNAEANIYSYRLNDNKTWIELETNNRVMLSNLKTGDYTLQIRGSNSDEVWSNKIAEINFKITPAWWASNIALIIYASIITIACMLIYRNKQLTIKSLSYQANHDALTGLPNRLYLIRKLNHMMEEYQQSNKPFCLIFFDINRFKYVNDTFGHDCGDAVLMALSERVSSAIRKHDFLARLAGDEFILLLPETDEEGLKTPSKRIIENLEETFSYKDIKIKFSASFGVVIYDGNKITNSQLLENADQAMYQAKKLGDNKFFIHRYLKT